MIILDEKEYAQNCLKTGYIDSKPTITLSILARYYYYEFGYRKKKIATLLIDFLDKHYPRYALNELDWQTSIEKIAANAGKTSLFQISGIRITRSEMDCIADIHNRTLERLMFTMLCLAKLNNERNPNNNGWVNTDAKDVFAYARIGCKADERDIKIGKLWQMGLLEFSKRNDNLNCRVTFIKDDDDEVLFISDFRELGYEYLLYCGGSFIRCHECGILTRSNKNGTKKYCKDCSTYTPQETKQVICVDCGIEFSTSSKNNRSCRCNACYLDYRKEKKLESQRERRANQQE